MADYTEFQSLVFDVRGTNDVKALEQAVIQEEAAVKRSTATHAEAAKGIYDFADSYDLVEQKLEKIVVMAPKVEQAFDWASIVSPKVRRLTEDFDFATIKLGKGMTTVEQATSTATRGLGRYQQQVTAAGYAFQDFTSVQGDFSAKLNAVTNNLPMIFAGMSGVGMAVSLAATAAVPLIRNWDQLTALFEERHPFPKTTSDLDGMRKKIEEVTKELGKLQAQGSVNDEGLARAKELQTEEASLKDAIKLREQVDSLKEQRKNTETQVANAFREAIKESGAKESLDTLEKDLKASDNPALKDLFARVFNKINEGSLDAFRALVDHAKTDPKYGNLAREMEAQLKQAFKQDGSEQPMDAAVKQFKADNNRVVDQLTNQGREVQHEMVEGMAKEAKEGTLAIVAEPLEALIIKGRAMGVEVGKEVSHLKNEAEAEAARLFPELQKMFPKAFEGVVAGIVNAVRDSVDKTIAQLQAMEGLTKQEAIRRLNQQRQAKGQANVENLALDEFTQAASRTAANPEQARQQAQQMQGRMQQAGVSGRGQVTIGKAMNTPGGENAIAEAMEALLGAGFDEASAMQALPNVLEQMANGRQAPQAVDQFLNAQDRRQGAAMNRAANQAARPAPQFRRGRANAGPRGGGGFRSVAPQAPGEGGGGGGGGGGDAVVGAVGQLANVVQSGDAVNAGHIQQLYQLVSQLGKAVQQQGAEIQRAQRRAFQDGDSRLPQRF